MRDALEKSKAERANHDDKEFLEARRELYLARALARDRPRAASGSSRSRRARARGTTMIGEVATTDELMEADGWSKDAGGEWKLELQGAVHLPRVPAGRVVRRRIVDVATGEVVRSAL